MIHYSDLGKYTILTTTKLLTLAPEDDIADYVANKVGACLGEEQNSKNSSVFRPSCDSNTFSSMFREKWKVLPDYKIGDKIPSKKSRNVLIATTFRSGSTLLGDLLNHYPGTFYTYEPFWIDFLSQNVN